MCSSRSLQGRGSTLEPLSESELLQRELTQKAVTEELGAFNRGGMKPFVVKEKIVRPDTATLRERVAGTAGSESFQQQGPSGTGERGAGAAESESFQQQRPPGAREQGEGTAGSKSCQRQ